ncbi:MAG: hypothetical protein H6709_14205 [Kofleriaceae bacterium]|nr:hypothetical protein [Kofleriaceae bacterium]
MLSIVVAACGGDDGFTDAAPGPDAPVADAAAADAEMIDGTPDADVTPPETTITAQPAAVASSATATFEFTADEAAAFECDLDGGGFAACTSPASFPDLVDGAHHFEVRATDGAGNVDATPAAYDWSIDTVAPETTIDQAPPLVDNSRDVSFAFSADEDGTFECDLDGAGFAACTSPQAYVDLVDATHTFTVRAIDLAGNVDPTPAVHTWVLDATTPDTPDRQRPGRSDQPGRRHVHVLVAQRRRRRDLRLRPRRRRLRGVHVAGDLHRLAEGAHTFTVRVTDEAANSDPTPATATWTIDLTAPDTTLDTAPVDPSPSATATFTFSADEVGATFACDLDGAGFTACTSPATCLASPMAPTPSRCARDRRRRQRRRLAGQPRLDRRHRRAGDHDLRASPPIRPTSSSRPSRSSPTRPRPTRATSTAPASSRAPRHTRSPRWPTAPTRSRSAPPTPPATPTRPRPATPGRSI